MNEGIYLMITDTYNTALQSLHTFKEDEITTKPTGLFPSGVTINTPQDKEQKSQQDSK